MKRLRRIEFPPLSFTGILQKHINMPRQKFGHTLLAQGHTLDGDAAPIDSGTLYNVDGGKVIPTAPERRGKRKVTKPKVKR